MVKHRIIEMINSEEYKVDNLIPSERELMDMFQVSRITVRKAIDDLVNEGYLYRIQGRVPMSKTMKSHMTFFQ